MTAPGAKEEPKPSAPKITKHPKQKPETHGKKATAKFAFGAAGGGASYKCRLDKSKFKPCSSPVSLQVKPGRHTFAVETIGPSGEVSNTATYKFTVVHQKG